MRKELPLIQILPVRREVYPLGSFLLGKLSLGITFLSPVKVVIVDCTWAFL